jgi:hypothetical protein
MPTMKIIGSNLAVSVQQECLRRFVNRFTGDHRPSWIKTPRPNGKSYPLHFASDVDWLAHTVFNVKADGTLNERFHHCESSPTWPDNPELRAEKPLTGAKYSDCLSS